MKCCSYSFSSAHVSMRRAVITDYLLYFHLYILHTNETVNRQMEIATFQP